MEITQKPRRRRRRNVVRMEHHAIGYLRASTEKQIREGATMEAQRDGIERAAAARGLTIVSWYTDDALSGGLHPTKRPGLAAALEELAAGTAGMLIFHKLDRVSRKSSDALNLRDLADSQGWALSSSDGAYDSSTPTGRLMYATLANHAEFERDMIRVRTREGLAAKRAQGVRLGRPSVLPESVVRRIVEERDGGGGWSAIARGLMADDVPTARGGSTWHPSAVQKVYNGQDAARVAAA